MLLRDFTEKTKRYMGGLSQVGLNLLFPPRCIGCGGDVDEAHRFCRDCFGSLAFVSEPCCKLCGFPFDYDLGQEALCGHCMHNPPPYETARTVLRYDEHSRTLITAFKYADRTDRMPAYAALLARAGAQMIAQSDVIIPVPLHRRRLLNRGYNQSALLAYGISDRCDLPVWPDGLRRIRHTPPQAGLTRAQRLKNVVGAFRVNHSYANALRGKRVLLVDDVMTTGATIQQAAQMLLGGGAKAVYVLTLARTIRD